MEKKKQEWRDIPGFEGYFMVSNIGQVYNVQKQKKLKTRRNHNYASIMIYNNKGYERAMVHRLVAAAFLPNPNSDLIVNHINTVRHDNRADNLEWCSYSDNVVHFRDLGLGMRKYDDPVSDYDYSVLAADADRAYNEYDVDSVPEVDYSVVNVSAIEEEFYRSAIYFNKDLRFLINMVGVHTREHGISNVIQSLVIEKLTELGINDEPKIIEAVNQLKNNKSLFSLKADQDLTKKAKEKKK